MYNYLSTVVADTDDVSLTPLILKPQGIVTESGSKVLQKVNIVDDGVESRSSFDDNSTFTVSLSWSKITSTEALSLKSYYYDSTKGNGKMRSFPWTHPKDTKNYVVRFDSSVPVSWNSSNSQGITNIKLKVFGNY